MNLAFVCLQAQAGADYSFLIMMVAIFCYHVFLHDSSTEQETERNSEFP